MEKEMVASMVPSSTREEALGIKVRGMGQMCFEKCKMEIEQRRDLSVLQPCRHHR